MSVLHTFVPRTNCVPRVQSQVDEVIDVMQENISKVIERGERLDDLQDKSGELCQSRKVRVIVSKSTRQMYLSQKLQGMFNHCIFV